MSKKANAEEGAFFVVANKRIIRECRLHTGNQSVETLEVYDGNQYPDEGAAVKVAEGLARRYTSDFYVLKAVKVVRRERPPIEVTALK